MNPTYLFGAPAPCRQLDWLTIRLGVPFGCPGRYFGRIGAGRTSIVAKMDRRVLRGIRSLIARWGREGLLGAVKFMSTPSVVPREQLGRRYHEGD